MNAKDGGSAFPRPGPGAHDGMSLRDYFAAQAMAAFLVSPETALTATESPAACAEWAYRQADAMLKAREAK